MKIGEVSLLTNDVKVPAQNSSHLRETTPHGNALFPLMLYDASPDPSFRERIGCHLPSLRSMPWHSFTPERKPSESTSHRPRDTPPFSESVFSMLKPIIQ